MSTHEIPEPPEEVLKQMRTNAEFKDELHGVVLLKGAGTRNISEDLTPTKIGYVFVSEAPLRQDLIKDWMAARVGENVTVRFISEHF